MSNAPFHSGGAVVIRDGDSKITKHTAVNDESKSKFKPVTYVLVRTSTYSSIEYEAERTRCT